MIDAGHDVDPKLIKLREWYTLNKSNTRVLQGKQKRRYNNYNNSGSNYGGQRNRGGQYDDGFSRNNYYDDDGYGDKRGGGYNSRRNKYNNYG